jgi:hypothetical protein
MQAATGPVAKAVSNRQDFQLEGQDQGRRSRPGCDQHHAGQGAGKV